MSTIRGNEQARADEPLVCSTREHLLELRRGRAAASSELDLGADLRLPAPLTVAAPLG